MISYRILVTVICALACVSCTPPKHASPIDAVLESAVDSGRIPGVIAVAATSDGIIYQGAAGNRDMSSGSEMTFDTIVQITSMTKAVTSVAVMQLVEQGEIELDQPVSSYLPRFAGVEVLGSRDGGEATRQVEKVMETKECGLILIKEELLEELAESLLRRLEKSRSVLRCACQFF